MPRKELTAADRERIIGAYLTNSNFTVISLQLDIPVSTVYDTIKRYKKKGSAQPQVRPGRPKKLTSRDIRSLQRIVHKDRFTPLGRVTNQLNTNLNTTLHATTVRKYLHDIGLNSCSARCKPLLTKTQQKNRLQWCKGKREWNEEWKNIIWSDESRFALFESDGRVKVWRRAGEAYNEECIKPTVKFGGGSIMFWGCFGWRGVGPLVAVEGNMNSDTYVDVLANYLVPWIRDHPSIIFQQDGAPCHTASYTIWWMLTHGIPLLDWVAQSPDLNPIEHLWDHLDCQIRKRQPLPNSKQELIRAAQEEWVNIDIETLHRLILSLPKRVKAVIEAKGQHTKY